MKHLSNNTISIIVPVYNTQKSLPLCLKSLLTQTYSDIEIILINDGSTDQSLDICKKYKKKDDRIKVINQDNKGRSAVRNVGISHASGRYIMFVDSDDYVTRSFCCDAINSVQKYDADIGLFDYYLKDKHQAIARKTSCHDGILTKEEAMLTTINASFLPMKIFKKELFSGVSFPIGKNFEDVFVTYQLIYKANRICHVPIPLYYYVQNDGSITHINSVQSISDLFEASLTRLKFLKENFPKAALCAEKNIKVVSFFYLIYDKNGKFSAEAKDLFKSKVRPKVSSKKLLIAMFIYRLMPHITEIMVKKYFS